jgi:hypothetical protein
MWCPLWVLFIAVQFVDVVWCVLIISKIERADITNRGWFKDGKYTINLCRRLTHPRPG